MNTSTQQSMNNNLLIAGSLSALASLLHLGCIYFGASWYRFFGAGEHMAQLAEQGSWHPTIVTLGITLILAIWSCYAFSAAGLIRKIPLRKLALVAITFVYLIRGIAGLFLATSAEISPLGNSIEFWFWSSAICLILGIFHLIGLKQQWVKL